MTDLRPRLVLFDCDGTLADSCGLICEAMRRMFLAHELPEPAHEASRAVIGLSLDRAIHRLHPACPPQALNGMVEAYRQIFRQTRNEPEFSEALFPGALELLRRLHARDDVLLGLVTGKTRRGVTSIFEAHGLSPYFAVRRTADDCHSKPHPAMVLECCGETGVSPQDTVVIGDAVFDMQMAKAAGASALGVEWGASPGAALIEAGADAVAADMSDLERRLAAWLGGASCVSAQALPDASAQICEARMSPLAEAALEHQIQL